jgi:antitoxin (DNA-binding transcriptional repressor) of toxin-antitoxin stability system
MTCYNAVTIVTIQEEVMRTVEARELEEKIDEVLEQVRETGEIVAVTRDGEIIAHLVPAGIPQWLAPVPGDASDNAQDIWTSFDQLSAEISAHWPKDVSAVDAIRDVRREL